ncbi:MAG: hypothetical protein M0Z75_16585 [Nitrospiraceae bacterium]|nr:hypothetical protein [Nitrospiraceae bacterium]
MEPKETVSGIYELLMKVIDAVEFEQKSSLHSRTVFLDEANRIIRDVRRRQPGLVLKLLETGEKDPSFLKYTSVPGHIERICEYMENINRALRALCTEGVRFSDKAMDEVNYLFVELKGILVSTSGTLSSGDLALAGRVKQAELVFSESARKFVLRHGERIAEGICLPRASSLYMDILDSFRAIAWHSKEIAQELLG